jgi:hypothetical protein
MSWIDDAGSGGGSLLRKAAGCSGSALAVMSINLRQIVQCASPRFTRLDWMKLTAAQALQVMSIGVLTP